MAKILPPDPADFKQIQCRNCFVKVEYAPEEVTTDSDCDGDLRYWIVCPKCTKSILVSNPMGKR